jgi:peroxin-10
MGLLLDEVCSFLCYVALFCDVGATATQTLGEEYTDIWQYSSSHLSPPPSRVRASLILLPTVSAYILGRWGTSSFSERYPSFGKMLKTLPVGLEVFAEINLAIFYLRGTYYDILKRLLGIRYVRSLR